MTNLEIIAALLGLANIILIVRRSIWNYPFALAMVALSAVVFFDAKLYSDAGLQIFFFVVNIYGWWAWSRNLANDGAIRPLRLGAMQRAGWIAGSVLATGLWGWFMHVNTDASSPWWDASIAMLSVAGQILMTRRYVENWHWWIIVNIISVALYFSKGLFYFTGLYGIFLVIAVVGLAQWRRVAAQT